MSATDRLLPAAALCAAGILASACVTDAGAETDAGSGAAGYLADQADLLADRIADDRPCEAIEHGERLVARTWATVSAGELPTATAAHVEEVVTQIVDHLVCEEPEDAEDAPHEVASDDTEDADAAEGARTAAPRDEPDERDAASGGGADRDDPSTSSRGSDPPGQGEGRGRDDAPGQNRGGPPAGRGGGR